MTIRVDSVKPFYTRAPCCRYRQFLDALQLDEFAPRSEGDYNHRTPAPRFDYG